MWFLTALFGDLLDRTPAPVTAAFLTTLGIEEKQLLYATLAAVLSVLIDWLRRKLTDRS